MFNQKILSYIFIVISIILLFLFTLIKIDYDNKSAILCEKFHETNKGMENCPVHNNIFSWVVIISYAVSFIILLMGIYILFDSKNNKEKKDFVEVDYSKLSEEENNIYNLIKSKGGSAYQSDLIKETNLSKVKITRILDKLEVMHILERKRRGMTNIIVLK